MPLSRIVAFPRGISTSRGKFLDRAMCCETNLPSVVCAGVGDRRNSSMDSGAMAFPPATALRMSVMALRFRTCEMRMLVMRRNRIALLRT